jgi:hypothetical protein
MLGSSCSSCCGWTCYYTPDSGPPVAVTNFRRDSIVCRGGDLPRVYAVLKWDTPTPGECIPLMYYEVQIAVTGESPQWQTAKKSDSSTANYITREEALGGVEILCDYAQFYTVAGQIAYYRSNGTNQERQVQFRVRATAASGPHFGESTAWAYNGTADTSDPRAASFSSAYIENAGDEGWTPNIWYYSVPVGGSSCQSGATWDIEQTTRANADIGVNPVWSALAVCNSSGTTTGAYTLALSPSSGAIAGYGVLANGSEGGSAWLRVSMRNVPEVMWISDRRANPA